jgi:hypothetical protein
MFFPLCLPSVALAKEGAKPRNLLNKTKAGFAGLKWLYTKY